MILLLPMRAEYPRLTKAANDDNPSKLVCDRRQIISQLKLALNIQSEKSKLSYLVTVGQAANRFTGKANFSKQSGFTFLNAIQVGMFSVSSFILKMSV